MDVNSELDELLGINDALTKMARMQLCAQNMKSRIHNTRPDVETCFYIASMTKFLTEIGDNPLRQQMVQIFLKQELLIIGESALHANRNILHIYHYDMHCVDCGYKMTECICTCITYISSEPECQLFHTTMKKLYAKNRLSQLTTDTNGIQYLEGRQDQTEKTYFTGTGIQIFHPDDEVYSK